MISHAMLGMIISLLISIGAAMLLLPVRTVSIQPDTPKRSAPMDPVVSAYVLAEHDGYTGYALLQALTICDLQFDHDRQIFHKYDKDNKQPWFSLAVAKEPGTFDFDQLGAKQYPGVALFMDLSVLGAQAQTALAAFFSTLSQLQEELGGQVVNAKRQAISESARQQWLQFATHITRQHGSTRDLFSSTGDT